jgi:serine/threonine protein kinase
MAASDSDDTVEFEQLELIEQYLQSLQDGCLVSPQEWAEQSTEFHETDLDALRVVRLMYDTYRTYREDTTLAVPDGKLPPTHGLLPPMAVLGGKYTIISFLGQGGMGDVYLAWHEDLCCQRAVKVLPARASDRPEAIKRFRKEIEIQARVMHPNIAVAMDAGEDRDRVYLVMEYIPGKNLRDLVQEEGPLDWKRACHVVFQAALGLRCAHENGMVHRDIKPSNLLLSPNGTVKILDLGLARLLTSASGDVTQTRPGALLGTVDYMPPEQAADPRSADARSDLYSLGCTFYFLLTGHPPFGDRSWAEKLAAHVAAQPEPVDKDRPDIPRAVAEIVHKLLAKKPEDRYASAEQLLSVLRSLCPAGTELLAQADFGRIAETSPSQEPVPLLTRPKRSGRKTRWIALGDLLAIALLAVVVYVA